MLRGLAVAPFLAGATTPAAALGALGGRQARRMRAGTWEAPAIRTFANQAILTGWVAAVPLDILERCTLDRIGWNISAGPASAANVRFALYADDGTGKPGALLLDSGSLSVASGVTGNVLATVSQSFTPQRIWTAGQIDVAMSGSSVGSLTTLAEMPLALPTGSTGSSMWGYYVAQAYGAFPASPTWTNNSATLFPMAINVRVGSLP